MTKLRHSASRRELDPESPFAGAEERPALPSILLRSISGSYSAPELARLKGFTPERSPSPRKGAPARPWHQLAAAFLSGAALAVFCTGHLSLAGLLPHTKLPAVAVEAPLPAAALPATLGLAPLALQNLTGSGEVVLDRLIVAARHNDDTSWLDTYVSEIPHIVYQVDDQEATPGAQHHTLVNKGNEAMAYLQFIIDYYDRLPAHILFIHGHRGTWHMKDHVPLIRRLRWGALPFANLRHRNGPANRLAWKCGNQTEDAHFRQFHCDWVGNYVWLGGLAPRQQGAVTAMNRDEWVDSMELQSVWPQVFEAELGPPPEKVHGPCCAEFIVARERILAHPRAFYVHLRDWIVGTELDRYRSGRVFEYMWHVMFGEGPVLEPVEECALLTCSPEEEAAAAQPTPYHKPFSEGDK